MSSTFVREVRDDASNDHHAVDDDEENVTTLKVWTEESPASHHLIRIDTKNWSETQNFSPSSFAFFKIVIRVDRMTFCPVCGLRLQGQDAENHLVKCLNVPGETCQGHKPASRPRKTLHPCQHCSKTFSTLKLLDDHSAFCSPNVNLPQASQPVVSHPEKAPAEPKKKPNGAKNACQICGKAFKSAQYLKDHLNIHTGNKPYKCQYCDKVFAGRSVLRQHLLTHSSREQFKCDLCSRSFKRKEGLDYHLSSHTRDRDFMCSICAKDFRNLRDLRAHEKLVHLNKENKPERREKSKDRRCDTCALTFLTEESFAAHQRTHAHPTRPTFPCPECPISCPSQTHLDIHLRSHTGEKPFACRYCEKSFRRKIHVTLHEARHTKDFRFPCSICDKGFPQASELRAHLSSAHVPSILTNHVEFPCHLCDKTFSCEAFLEAHIKMHEDERLGDIRELSSIPVLFHEDPGMQVSGLDDVEGMSTLVQAVDVIGVETVGVEILEDAEGLVVGGDGGGTLEIGPEEYVNEMLN